MFEVEGVTDDYIVEINQQADLWPPTCSCEDNAWRPDVLCKHILFVLQLLGVEEEFISDCVWEPEQAEL